VLRILYIYVALALSAVSGCGHEREQESNRESAVGQRPQTVQEPRAANPHNQSAPAQSPAANQLHPPPSPSQQYRPAPARIPAAQYSPLAAQGGYDQYRRSPWEAIVHELNPWNLNLGQVWEQRRQAWLDNAATNRYFWYAFCATGLLILSWFALAWIQIDRINETWDLAEDAADALRYSEYCKRQAKDAILRHNEHVEKCNRVIEAAESGLVTPETASLESFKQQLRKARADNESLTLQRAKLQEDLQRKESELHSLTERVTKAEQTILAKRGASSGPNAELVERIRRLEEQNRRLQRQLARGGNEKPATVATEADSRNEQC
jgi:hypothetical protein